MAHQGCQLHYILFFSSIIYTGLEVQQKAKVLSLVRTFRKVAGNSISPHIPTPTSTPSHIQIPFSDHSNFSSQSELLLLFILIQILKEMARYYKLTHSMTQTKAVTFLGGAV
jgi:hypothetical protein